MAAFRCKKCGARNTIPQEWIDLGISRVISCTSCGHKMNLNLGGPRNPSPKGTQVVEKPQHTHNADKTNISGLEEDATESKMFCFQVIEGTNTKSLSLSKNLENYTIYIGRNPESKLNNINPEHDIIWEVNDPYASRLHCTITVINKNNQVKFILQDARSANGTKINKEKLDAEDQVLLHINDQLEIGNTLIELKQN